MTVPGIRPVTAIALLATIGGLSPPAQAVVESLTVTTPRQFGYVIGDRIEHRVALVLRPGFELDPASIPAPGRTTRWLSLNEAVLDGKARDGTSRHTIRLRYQVVNAAQTVIGAGTPPVSLRIIGPEDDLPVVIPAWAFTIGPIVRPEERLPGTLPDLRSALPPPPVPTTERTARVTGLGLLATALLLLVAWRHLRGRFKWFAPGPFGHACRRLERRMRHARAPGAYADALIDVHGAFNATAGRAVFAHDLQRFFVEHPPFEPLRAQIERLFAESVALFYGSSEGASPQDGSLDRVRALCLACREVERRR